MSEHENNHEEQKVLSLDEIRSKKEKEIDDLIEKSSLGTPAAKKIRARTPPEVVERILERSREIRGTEPATVSDITSAKKSKKGGPHEGSNK